VGGCSALAAVGPLAGAVRMRWGQVHFGAGRRLLAVHLAAGRRLLVVEHHLAAAARRLLVVEHHLAAMAGHSGLAAHPVAHRLVVAVHLHAVAAHTRRGALRHQGGTVLRPRPPETQGGRNHVPRSRRQIRLHTCDGEIISSAG
jgi:hypothetical protein